MSETTPEAPQQGTVESAGAPLGGASGGVDQPDSTPQGAVSPVQPEPDPAPVTTPDQPEPVLAEPSVPLEPSPGSPLAPAEPGTVPQPASAPAPEHKVRVFDVVRHLEHFFMLHPELEKNLLTDLRSGVLALERFV